MTVVSSAGQTAVTEAAGEQLRGGNLGDFKPVPLKMTTGETLKAVASGPCSQYVTFSVDQQGVLTPHGARIYLAATTGSDELDVDFHGCSACTGPSIPIGRIAVTVHGNTG